MLPGSQHFEGRGACWNFKMGLGRMTSTYSLIRTCTKPNNKLISAQLERFWCQDKPWANLNSKDSPWPELGESHHLPLYSILCVSPQGPHSNNILSWDSKIAKIEISATLGPHNFACRPLIEMRFDAKLQPLSRAFQRYVAHHLHVRKSCQFLTFSGQESNY